MLVYSPRVRTAVQYDVESVSSTAQYLVRQKSWNSGCVIFYNQEIGVPLLLYIHTKTQGIKKLQTVNHYIM